jgi:calcineurin-like phosphoesterase
MHVQTTIAACRPGNCGITDVGMTGLHDPIIGTDRESRSAASSPAC